MLWRDLLACAALCHVAALPVPTPPDRQARGTHGHHGWGWGPGWGGHGVAGNSQGMRRRTRSWGVGSCVVIPCTLSYPDDMAADDGIVAIWYKDYDNQKTLVYHSAAQEVDAGFRDRAQLLGDPAARNCTLLLRRLTLEDHGPYRFRFEIINGDRWSAERDVMLSVLGGYSGETPPLCQLPACLSSHRHPTLCSLPLCSPSQPSQDHESSQPNLSIAGWGCSNLLRCCLSYRPPLSHPTSLPIDPPRNLQMKAFTESGNGTAVILLCVVESNPLSKITFRISLAPNTLRLELREASAEDEGEYECQARSPLGSAYVSLPLRVQGESVFMWGEVGWGSGCLGRWGGNAVLIVVDAPQEPSFISLVDPRGGRQAVLLCTVDSFPPSDIALYRGPGHAPLASTHSPADPRFTVQAAPNSLRMGMAGLELQDAGLYICSANNSYGTASSSLLLDVGGEGSPEPQQDPWGGPGVPSHGSVARGGCLGMVASCANPGTP
uniref:Sialic acid binding Ig like lectin 1 n=1 Tax=Falco tinnunculus TaxID=100819 RepID=A0A8C4V4K2_FALTI